MNHNARGVTLVKLKRHHRASGKCNFVKLLQCLLKL